MKKNYLQWKIGFDIDNQEYIGNDLLAQKLSKKGYDSLINDYVYIYPKDVQKTFELMPNAREAFKGTGVDLGAGIGCISSTVALKDNVKKIYSVEVVANVVKLCQPIIKKKILKEKADKVISVIGDFDNLEVKDGSLDFAVCWFSMHHSLNPVRTFKESFRALKPGGRFIFVDKFHNNSTPDSEIERMLNIVYTPEFIEKNFRPKGTILTRRENGEHEYRLFEWEKFIKKSGFKMITEIILKTDNDENRLLKNDNNLVEIFVDYKIGGFGDRAVGFVVEKPL